MTEQQEIKLEYRNDEPSEASSLAESSDVVEQFGKDIVVGRKEISYKDGKNVISVIINAISVRINMPKGTVKVLMACLAVILIFAVIYAGNTVYSWNTDHAINEHVAEDIDAATEESETTEDTSESDVFGDDIVALKDYVNISTHFYYHLPDNVEEVWEPDELYAENETLCDFIYNNNLYSVRSYVLEYSDNDLADIVKADLSLFDNMTFIDEEYIDGKYGEILKIRFEFVDEDGGQVVGTGYYWYESIPKICCLEISSDEWHDDGAEEIIKDSIYRVSAGTTAPYTVDKDEAWSDYQKKEAMNSLAEDAMRDSYEQKPDYSDRTLKP